MAVIPALPALSGDIPENAGLRIPTSPYPQKPFLSLHPPCPEVSGGLYSITKKISRIVFEWCCLMYSSNFIKPDNTGTSRTNPVFIAI
jgi:hypothetical protein